MARSKGSLTPRVPTREELVASVLGRTSSTLQSDVDRHREAITERIAGARILVTGAAGSIGAATLKQIFAFEPARVAAVDVSENNLVELVRDLRSQPELAGLDALETFVIDFGSPLAERFLERAGPFDLVLHFAAMKHVRAERDPFTLARLIETNVLGVDRFLAAAKRSFGCDVFAISTDKACRPANFMGASKRLMEAVVRWHAEHPGSLLGGEEGTPIRRVALTRFANVAFSDGSLLHGFLRRIERRQPLAGPSDVRRHFISDVEAGQLCLLTAVVAESGQIVVPRESALAAPRRFDELAERVLEAHGYRPRWHPDIATARRSTTADLEDRHYPCCFAPSATSGEKALEEFVSPDEKLGETRFHGLDVIVESGAPDASLLAETLRALASEIAGLDPEHSHARLGELILRVVPTFEHLSRPRNLDQSA